MVMAKVNIPAGSSGISCIENKNNTIQYGCLCEKGVEKKYLYFDPEGKLVKDEIIFNIARESTRASFRNAERGFLLKKKVLFYFKIVFLYLQEFRGIKTVI